MGCAANKYDHHKALRENPFCVGPSLFVNLEGVDINRNYKIDKVLGTGAFGEVKLVFHNDTQTQRAMKQLSKSKVNNQSQLFSEVQILKYLDHPNILKIYELYQDAKNYYIVSEYLSGGELYMKLLNKEQDKKVILTEKVASEYMQQILEALAYSHTSGVMHRDLKPGNILFESDEPGAQLKVIDFGAAKQIDDSPDSDLVGTPYYVAPETFQSYYDEKCDVWSLGLILLQMLTGKLPFEGKTDETQVLLMIKNNKVNLSKTENISPQAKTLLKKMLTVDPEKRISVEQALRDPWIKSNNITKPLSEDVINSLQTFHSSNKLKYAIMQLIATQLMHKDVKKQLIQQFKSMDQNGDGKLNKEELTKGYVKIIHDQLKATHIVEEIFKSSDADHSQTIDYSEFLVAASKQNELLSKDKIEQVFKMFDKDGNGIITIEELKKVMAGAEKNTQWKELIQDFDANHDGQISHQEFIDTLLQKLS